jgi:hypothetical protein
MNDTHDDLERRLRGLAAQAEGIALPPGRALRAVGDRRRRLRRRLGAGVVVACVIAAAVGVGVFGPRPSSTHVPVSKAPTTTTTVPAAAVTSLDAYVARETTQAQRAATRAGQASPFVGAYSAHSVPVDDDGRIVAVAAFFYSAAGHPVQVLSYAAGTWSVVAALGPDLGAPVQPLDNRHVLALDPGTPVSVADVTGDGRPDFLVLLSAASATPGVVVSQDGGTWRYVPNRQGSSPASDVLFDDPRFQDGRLVSTYDDCVPDCASGQSVPIVWTYERSSGEFRAPGPPGSTAATTATTAAGS